MSFINIKDPKKRDAIVAEYLATVKRLQDRGISERAQDLTRTEEINRVLELVVRSTAKSTEAIAKELIPIREEIQVGLDVSGKKPLRGPNHYVIPYLDGDLAITKLNSW